MWIEKEKKEKLIDFFEIPQNSTQDQLNIDNNSNHWGTKILKLICEVNILIDYCQNFKIFKLGLSDPLL